MSKEEFRLDLAAIADVAALAVPPLFARAVQNGARGAFDGDVGAGDRYEGPGPLFVAEGGDAFKDDLFG